MSFFEKIAEQKIRKGVEEGFFDNLPNSGQPLVYEDETAVPEDLRMVYKMLKNAGYIPPELELRKQILNLQELIYACENEDERQAHRGKLSLLQIKLDLMEQRNGRRLSPHYRDQVFQKLQ